MLIIYHLSGNHNCIQSKNNPMAETLNPFKKIYHLNYLLKKNYLYNINNFSLNKQLYKAFTHLAIFNCLSKR